MLVCFSSSKMLSSGTTRFRYFECDEANNLIRLHSCVDDRLQTKKSFAYNEHSFPLRVLHTKFIYLRKEVRGTDYCEELYVCCYY